MSSPATAAAAAASCGVLRHHHPPASPRPPPTTTTTSRLLLASRSRGLQRPLRVNHAPPRRLPPTAARAQSAAAAGYQPESEFYKVEAILRPWRVPYVSSGLLQMGIRGVTVSDVRGFGSQGGSTERHEGSEFAEDTFIDKVKMEIVVSKDQVEAVVDKIIEKARTGEIGDGKIFLIPVSDVIRIRTGERGERAERMAGGLADKLSSAMPIS
uniref:PII protein n=1 Tax=Oryza glumipatula TaxID=40148 RepID=A0A0D9ZTV4_9ORYZ